MRVLLLHSRRTSFRAVRKALKDPPDPPSSLDLGECLVVFVSVEDGDGRAEVERLVSDSVEQAGRLGVRCILLYPFAHLSSRLAEPRQAYSLLVEAERILRDRWDGEVYRAPFGWYKSFTVECVGHPLCELSREYRGLGASYTHSGSTLELRDAERRGLAPRFTQPWSGESVNVMARFGLYPKVTPLGAEIASGALLHASGGISVEAEYRWIPRASELPEPHALVRVCLEHLERGGTGVYPLAGAGDVLAFEASDGEALGGVAGLAEGLHSRVSELPASREGEGLNLQWYADYRGKLLYYTSPTGKAVPLGAWIESSGRGAACIGPSLELARALVDNGVAEARSGRVPYMPFWASPVHVAVIPVKEAQEALAEDLASRLAALGLRVYVDPPTRGLGARIRAAGRLWALYVAVIGEREALDGTVSVRRRREGDQVVMPVEEFVEEMTRMALEPPSPRRPWRGPPTPLSYQ